MKPIACKKCLSILGLVFLVLSPVRAGDNSQVRWTLVVEETEGIRRFGHPVSAFIKLKEPVKDITGFRLLRGSKVVPAQIQADTVNDEGITALSIDFRSSHQPFEKKVYILEYNPAGKPTSKLGSGIRVEQQEAAFYIIHSKNLQYVVPRNLVGLLQSVKTGRGDYLRPESTGLWITSGKDKRVVGENLKPSDLKATITKKGPYVAGLRFELVETIGNKEIPMTIDMDFPRNRSWVRVDWRFKAPTDSIGPYGLDLNLNIQSSPTLVDFGAGRFVYARLKKGQYAVLENISRLWKIPDTDCFRQKGRTGRQTGRLGPCHGRISLHGRECQ